MERFRVSGTGGRHATARFTTATRRTARCEPHGQPQLSVVWLRTDGHDILVSTTTNRRKYAEVVGDPRVSLLISPREQPYVYVAVKGTTTITTDSGPELDADSSSRRVSAARSLTQELASRGRTG
jgi:PPOX class probable F420-dependent enzyme